MKKTLFTCAMFAVALCASAYDEIGVKSATPLVVDEITQVSLVLNNSSYVDCLRFLQCTVELPSDWIVDIEYTINKERFCDYNTKLKKWGTSKFSIDCDYGADNELKLLMYGTDPANTLNLTEGELFTFGVYVPEGTPAGYYPVVIKNGAYMAKSSVDAENIYFGEMVSYVKVGDPVTGNLALSGTVPSFVNEALATETAISNLNLSGVTASNGTFTYVDGREVVAPNVDFATTATYSKSVTDGKYASLTLPFDANFEEGTAYKFTTVENGYAKFEEVSSAEAGDVVLLTKNVNLEGTKLGAATKSVQSEAYYVAPDGTELHKGTNVTIPALRGYWNLPANSNLRIAIDGVLTDINMADVQGEGADAFDLQGRQVQNAKNGVFVVNGKKQFVK